MRISSSQCTESRLSGRRHSRERNHRFEASLDASRCNKVQERGGDATNIPPRDRNLKCKEASMPKDLPSPELLRKLLRYEPETGKLFWRERPVEMFEAGTHSALRNCAAWNGRYANKEAFTCVSPQGYLCGRIYSNTYFAHRIIWALCYDVEPDAFIDHIDGDPTNNKLENLRQATKQQNSYNRGRNKNNKSGYKGVYWDNRKQRWLAKIGYDNGLHLLGHFKTPEEAHDAYCRASQKHHHSFANSGETNDQMRSQRLRHQNAAGRAAL